jgi:hypothetical protein
MEINQLFWLQKKEKNVLTCTQIKKTIQIYFTDNITVNDRILIVIAYEM